MSCLKIISCCPTRFKDSNDVTIPYIRQVGTLFRSVLLKSIHPVQGREGRDNTVRHVDTTPSRMFPCMPFKEIYISRTSSEAEKKNLAKKNNNTEYFTSPSRVLCLTLVHIGYVYSFPYYWHHSLEVLDLP